MMPSLLGVGEDSLWKGETGLLFIGFGTAFLTQSISVVGEARVTSDLLEAYVVA